MGIKGIIQPDIIIVDKELRLRKTKKEDWDTALPWYQNPEIMYYSEGVTDKKYDMDDIENMYSYLNENGELYFIQALECGKWETIGDVTLSQENLPIVIGDEDYWGYGIGKRVLEKLIKRGKNIGFEKIQVEIYDYNERSKKLFKSFGFLKTKDTKNGSLYEKVYKVLA